jgi:hypothetical protein
MSKLFKIFAVLLALSFFVLPVFNASAKLVMWKVPPRADFSGKFVAYKPVCTNGALVVVTTPATLLLLLPYHPIPFWPVVPYFKLWGPIPGVNTAGNFVPGGVCLVPSPTGVTPVPVMGTIYQIGTSAEPDGWIPTVVF